MTEDTSPQFETDEDLAEFLVANNVISVAQAELALADKALNDLPLDEVLIARGWIKQEEMYRLVPSRSPAGVHNLAVGKAPPAVGTAPVQAKSQESTVATPAAGNRIAAAARPQEAVERQTGAVTMPGDIVPPKKDFAESKQKYDELLQKILDKSQLS